MTKEKSKEVKAADKESSVMGPAGKKTSEEEAKLVAELEEYLKKELPDKDHVLFKRVKNIW